MSNALALAAVTAVLKGMLENVLVEQEVSDRIGAAVTDSALAPDRIQTGDEEKPQLNLFLYHVAPNPGWRNVDLPSHGQRGERLTNQPLALDLHYLVTAYGKADFELEVLLGYAAQAFHEQPVLTRDLVRNMLTAAAAPGGSASPVAQALAGSDLAEQIELVKLAPQMIGTEEMYRVWSAFQSHYRPTVAYQASVVLIEDRRPVGTALPVQERRLQALPFRQATIESVLPQVVTAGSRLILQGRNLPGETVRVRFPTAIVPPDAMGDRRIEVALPADLSAGVNTVQVVHAMESHAFESNVAPFVLRPTVTAPSAANVQGTGGEPRSADVTVQVDPTIGRKQRVVLLLNENSEDAPTAYSFAAPARDADAGSITIPVTGVKTGDYFLRLRVDGADSPLDLDRTSATFGPTITIHERHIDRELDHRQSAPSDGGAGGRPRRSGAPRRSGCCARSPLTSASVSRSTRPGALPGGARADWASARSSPAPEQTVTKAAIQATASEAAALGAPMAGIRTLARPALTAAGLAALSEAPRILLPDIASTSPQVMPTASVANQGVAAAGHSPIVSPRLPGESSSETPSATLNDDPTPDEGTPSAFVDDTTLDEGVPPGFVDDITLDEGSPAERLDEFYEELRRPAPLFRSPPVTEAGAGYAPFRVHEVGEIFRRFFNRPGPPSDAYVVHSSIEDFALDYRRQPNVAETAEIPAGFYSWRDNRVHFPPGAEPLTSLHEILHYASSRSRPTAAMGGFVDEGMTEWLTREASGPDASSQHPYDANVAFVEIMSRVLPDGKNVITRAYLDGEWQALYNALEPHLRLGQGTTLEEFLTDLRAVGRDLEAPGAKDALARALRCLEPDWSGTDALEHLRTHPRLSRPREQ